MKRKGKLTSHGVYRGYERQGMSKKELQESFNLALKYGIRYRHASGKLKGYIWQLERKTAFRPATKVIIYNGDVYIYKNKKLITTYPLLEEFHSEAEAIQEQLKIQKNKSNLNNRSK